MFLHSDSRKIKNFSEYQQLPSGSQVYLSIQSLDELQRRLDDLAQRGEWLERATRSREGERHEHKTLNIFTDEVAANRQEREELKEILKNFQKNLAR